MITQDAILSSPVLLGALTVLVILGYHYQRGMSYREFMAAHTAKRILFPILNREAKKRGRALVHVKGYNDPELVRTVPQSPRQVARRLMGAGFSPHLIASLKARDHPQNGREYAHSQFVTTYDGNQTEVYLFADGDGTDIYCHVEPSATSPVEHLRGVQHDGDVDGKFAEAWNRSKGDGR